MFYAGVHFIQDLRHLRQAWGALLIGAAIMTAAGLAIFFLYGGSPLYPYVRAGSLHNGYGGMGTYLALVWPFLLLAPLAFDEAKSRPALYALVPLTALIGLFHLQPRRLGGHAGSNRFCAFCC